MPDCLEFLFAEPHLGHHLRGQSLSYNALLQSPSESIWVQQLTVTSALGISTGGTAN